jgi:hypothetical protein
MKPRNLLYIPSRRACMHALGIVLCCTAFEAAAADWTSISKTKQDEVLVDMDSYNESAGIPYISTKTLYVKPQNYRKNALKFSYSESHSNTQFNCRAHTYKINATQFYSANKKLVGSEKGDISFKPVTAGSKDAALASLVCQVHQMVGGN